MPHYKVIKHTVGKHKQLYYKIHLLENEFFRINSLDRISACRTGSGTLYLLQRHTSQAAVSRLILCPTETYIGLVDAADVFTACNAHHKNSIYCTVQVLWWPGNLPAQLLNTIHICSWHSLVPSTFSSEQIGSIIPVSKAFTLLGIQFKHSNRICSIILLIPSPFSLEFLW